MPHEDIGKTAEQLADENGGHWGEYARYPAEDWRYAVINCDTRESYWQWVVGQIAAED